MSKTYLLSAIIIGFSSFMVFSSPSEEVFNGPIVSISKLDCKYDDGQIDTSEAREKKFFYDENGRITKYVRYNSDKEIRDKMVFIYNEKGFLIQADDYDSDNKIERVYRYLDHDEHGNPRKVEEVEDGKIVDIMLYNFEYK